MVVGEASIHNIMGGMESTGGVRLHNHKRKLKQRFDIIKKLGQGTYGKVQLGINKETGQEVAIKTIKKCKIETEADLIRIRREIQIMSSVQHPNIIHIYEVFENKEKMVLVMEYAAGGELYDYLSERKVLSEQEARRIFRQISIAVFYCHKHKICHRDLKLENILLDTVGNAKIADFGLSNVFDNQRLLNTFCGSPLYASPEIVKGTPYHGPEVDCWSLGVLLYTLVYGAMPFDGSNFKRLTRQISQSDYFEPKVASPASPLIKDMLTKCPARRADIEKICSHWWVNDGYEQNCLDIAEDLAAQTPVRLDLLLSLVPQSASADKLVVGDERSANEVVNNMSSETLVPTRCHSVGSLMELDRNNSDRRVREMIKEEPRSATVADSKRKLETTPSMEDDVTGKTGTSKKKERVKKRDKSAESAPRTYSFASNRHHSAPIAANPITEEAMDIDLSTNDKVSTPKPLLDLRNDETAAACLELIKESLSKSPSKERSKTPVAPDQPTQVSCDTSLRNVNENVNDPKPISNKLAGVHDKSPEVTRREVNNTSAITAGSNEISTKANNESAIASEVPINEQDVRQMNSETNAKVPIDNESGQVEGTSVKDAKKSKEKAPVPDADLSNGAAGPSAKPTERRRSKIFETAEKFNLLATGVDNEKPKKIFIPGVNVGGAKRAFERKASLSSVVVPQTVKQSASKVIIDVPNDKKNDKVEDKSSTSIVKTSSEIKDETNKREEEKKRAVDIITGAIGKPPVQKKVTNGSPPITPQSPESKKLGLKIQVGPNDVRSATVSVSTPVDTKFPFEAKPHCVTSDKSVSNTPECQREDNSSSSDATMSSKMEITLKSATLPRPRKTSKAEITLSGIKSPKAPSYKSDIAAKIDAFHPQKLTSQRSEIAFPVAAVVPQAHRSASLEPEGAAKIAPKERIIPIQVESDHREEPRQSWTPPPKPPMAQRAMPQRSGSLSRQSTMDSDTDSTLGSTLGSEPIKKSPREYIIPIAVEGGGYVTPRSGSVEHESKNNTPTSTNPPRSRFGRPRRMSSLLSDASEDESPFSTLHRDSDDLLQRHMHRLRSSRPTRQQPEHADSLSSGEDDDDDGFELLTAENLFSTLLSRVRSLTQRLNVDDSRGSFPSGRLLGRLGSNSSQGFWGLHEPLSRRLTESQFGRSMSRDSDRFGTRDSAVPSNSASPGSPGARSTPSRESLFETGSNNTLPRDRKSRQDTESTGTTMDSSTFKKDAQDSLEQNFTPSLARRLSRQFIEQTRQSLPRSPSIPREKLYKSSTDERRDAESRRSSNSTISDRTETHRSRSCDRGIGRSNSLMENTDRTEPPRWSRRSVSLFDDEDEPLPPLPRQVMTLGRKYREIANPGPSNSLIRRESFHNYRTEKIQEEPPDELSTLNKSSIVNNDLPSISDCNSVNNSNTNLGDTASSLSARSFETSPTDDSFSNHGDNMWQSYKSSDTSRDFENRLLAAENLIKESKLRNLGPEKFDPNLTSSYKDTDKCDKELLSSMSDITGTLAKRRSCIPSLRLRSGSLTREASVSSDRRKTLSCSQDSSSSPTTALPQPHGATPERSILSKFFRAGSVSRDQETKEKSPKAKGTRRISRFLRPDFFDTPREESQYVKDKEAQKAAENERRKSRFIKKKSESNVVTEEEQQSTSAHEEKPEKELKNEANAITRDKPESLSKDNKSESDATSFAAQTSETKLERQSSKNSFFQSLEKKLEKFRSSDDGAKLPIGNGILVDNKSRLTSENSVPSVEALGTESEIIRATSVEDVPHSDAVPMTSKRRVSSVLGLFKSDASKPSVTDYEQRPQNTILSKFKRSTYKGSRSDSLLSTEPTPSTSNSKIPTKFGKVDATKLSQKIAENKSPEKIVPELDKSPTKVSLERSKETSPPKRIVSRKSVSMEKQTKQTSKKPSPEKCTEGKTDKPEKYSRSKDPESPRKLSSSPEKIIGENKSSSISVVSRLALKKTSPEKVQENHKQTKSKSTETETKIVKAKKSLTSLVKKNVASKLEKDEEGEKNVKKISKSKESSEKDVTDGTSKKKIVRVVKKVVKTSDSSDSKSEDKEKPTKTSIKKVTSSSKRDTSPEDKARSRDKNSEGKISKAVTKTKEVNSLASDNALSTVPIKSEKIHSEAMKSDTTEEYTTSTLRAKEPDATVNGKIPNNKLKKSDSECCKNLGSVKSNRACLRLDLSKIPQHSFKGTAVSKKENNAKIDETLSEITHEANINENKIPINNSLRAKDVTRLQDTSVEDRESLIQPQIRIERVEESNETKSECNVADLDTKPSARPTSLPLVGSSGKKSPLRNAKEIPNDYSESLFSPIDDSESFDSWSICSADMNHKYDLYSPTSPSYSPTSRSSHPESIIDRIRRKSFYSRFNERKRKSSLNVPSPRATLQTSSTLPRKYSFSSSRDMDYNKSHIHAGSSTRRHPERSYSLYNDDVSSYRKSPVDRDRYDRDVGSIARFSGDVRSPTEQYSSFSPYYDPLKRYRTTPSPNSLNSHKKYQSSDYLLDSENVGSYRRPVSPALLNDSNLECHSGRSLLPRRYGSVSSCPEAKSADYYEELLAPTRSDYLLLRKSPNLNEYNLGRHEKSYHNGNLESGQQDTDKWKTYTDKIAGLDLSDGSDGQLEKQMRSSTGKEYESQDLPPSGLEPDVSTFKVE